MNTNDPNRPVPGVYVAPRGIDTGFNALVFGPVAAGAAIAEQSYGLIATNTYSLSISQPTDYPGNAPSLSFPLSDTNIDGVGIALAQQLGARFVAWNVAWSDVQTGADGSVHDVLFANRLICSN